MRDRTGWIRGAAGPQRLGSKYYKNLVEFSRPCAACGTPFSIFVTPKIADEHADSNNFGLRNCEQHRRGNGISMAPEELETLRSKDRIMADELAGLYEQIRELHDRLAKYELQPAMEAKANDLTFPWGGR